MTTSRIPLTVRRGDIWWVNFGPGVGSEIRKRRPAIVVSVDPSNRNITRIQVVPTTSNASRLYPSEAYVTIAGVRSKAMADQLITVAQERFVQRIGRIEPNELADVEKGIRTQLGL